MLTEIATNVGQTFLGMTVNCARCHNHKFDPILQADFYRLQAVFAGAKGKDVEIATPDEKAAWEAAAEGLQGAAGADREGAQGAGQAFRRADRAKSARPSSSPKLLEALEHSQGQAHAGAEAPRASNAEAQIKPAWDEVVAVMPADVKAERAKLREQLHQVESTAPDPLPTAYAFVNTGEAAPQSYVLRLGDPHSRLDPVEPAVPRVLKAGYEIPHASPRAAAPPSPTGWRRRENPLTARVMVNRIWQFRMGDGLVRTPNDFGDDGRQARQSRAAGLAGRGVHGRRAGA